MTKMVSLKKTAAERKAEQKARDAGPSTEPYDDDGGLTVHLDHDHLTKMGVGGDLKNGHKVKFNGEGHVEMAESRSTPEGERHSARVRFTKGSMEHEAPEEEGGERGEIRGEINKAYDKGGERVT